MNPSCDESGPVVDSGEGVQAEESAASISLGELAEQLGIPDPDTHNFPLTERGIGPEAYIGEKL